MSLAFYMDENVEEKITRGLRLRGVDVVTVQEDGMRGRPDPELLDRATALGRGAVSEDEDFLAEAARRQRAGEHFGGVVRAPQGLAVGICVEGLEIIANIAERASTTTAWNICHSRTRKTMASSYVIKISGWADHAHEVTAHTEQEAQVKAEELVKRSNAEGVTLHAQGGRHDGKDHHWQGKNEDGHPREIKIVVGQGKVS